MVTYITEAIYIKPAHIRFLMYIEKAIGLLKNQYGKTFFLPRENGNEPYYVLISCLMSHRTKDEVTYPAAERLFRHAKTPKQMLKLKARQIEKIIYPVGFYMTKAKRILQVSRQLLDDYNGKVPDSMEELTKLIGIGRKTAGIVLTHAFHIPALPIDTHCHRIANRLGWVKTKKPEETERALMRIVPKKEWMDLN